MLETLDRQWTLAINSMHSPFCDSVWMFFSAKQIWFIFYALIAGLIIWRLGWKKGLIAILSIALCIVCVDQACNLVKDSVQRLRPCNDPLMYGNGLNVLASPSQRYRYGFFSAHAANAMAFAALSTLALRMDKRRKWAVYGVLVHIWALLVAVSRVFVGKHFLGDILTGLAVGLVAAHLTGILMRRVINRLQIR